MTTESARRRSRFNKAVHPTTLFIDAAAQGIDLKRVGAVHVMEPSDQAGRAPSHQPGRALPSARGTRRHRARVSMRCLPRRRPRRAAVKATLYASGMFAKEELAGITRRVQYALLALIADEEEHETIASARCARARDASARYDVLEQIQAVANEG